MADITSILVLILVIMAIALAFSIGANDETLSVLVGAAVLKFKIALIIGGVAIGCGMVFFSGGYVAKTVGSDILGESIQYTTYMLLVVLISSIIWLVVGSFAGIPLSSTHSLVGSVVGVVIVYAIFQGGINIETAFNWEKLGNVLLSWVISPLSGFIITFIFFKLIVKFYLYRLKGLNQIEKSEKYFKWILFIVVIFAEIWVGANSGEALGILYGLLANNSLNVEQYFFFSVICGIFAFIGIYIAARYVIKNLASQMITSRPSEGIIMQLSSSVILMIATLFGLPISHSHVVVFCILGLNLAQKKEIDYKSLAKMAVYWILTFPIAAILSGLLYYGLNYIGFI